MAEPLHELKWREVAPREMRELIRKNDAVMIWVDIAQSKKMSGAKTHGMYVKLVKQPLLAELKDWPANAFFTVAEERQILYVAPVSQG